MLPDLKNTNPVADQPYPTGKGKNATPYVRPDTWKHCTLEVRRAETRSNQLSRSMDANKETLQTIPVIREASFDDHRADYFTGISTRPWRPRAMRNGAIYGSAIPSTIEFQRHWPIGWVLENGGPAYCRLHREYSRSYMNSREEKSLRPNLTPGWSTQIIEVTQFCSWIVISIKRMCDLYLSTTVNSRSVQWLLRVFRSLKVPVGAWNQSAFWITHYRGFASSWAEQRGSCRTGVKLCTLSCTLFR